MQDSNAAVKRNSLLHCAKKRVLVRAGPCRLELAACPLPHRSLPMKVERSLPLDMPTILTPSGGNVAKGKQRILIRIAGICVAIGLLPLPASAHSTAEPVPGPAGRYCGKLLSSDKLVDVETSLRVDGQGHISGTYRFDDDGTTTVGSVSEVGTSGGRQRTLRWFDKYGMGSLTIRFAPGYRRFEGLWGPQGAAPSYIWNGGDCGAPIS